MLNSLNQPVLEKITGAYQALIEHHNEATLELPVAIPDWKSVKALQNDRINTAKAGDPLQDYVFACVIRGRKPTLLEFSLPHPIKGWFPPEYWRGLAAPALRYLVLMLGLSGGTYWVWQQWGNNLLQHQAEQEMRNTLNRYRIRVNYTQPQLQDYAQTLTIRLKQWGFNAEVEQLDSAEQTTVATEAKAIFSIEYSIQTLEDILKLVLQRLSYLTYGAPIKEIKNPEMAESDMLIKMQLADQSKSMHRDSFANVNPWWKGIDFGKYYALIIGNQNYQKIQSLVTPINDTRAVDIVLREKYGFDTTLLIDANRYQILTALNKLREKLTENDNLLIYYTGHGVLDKVNKRGHWLPVDAELDSDANWISTISITDILNAMSPRHILVVTDTVYSARLTRAVLTRLDAGMTLEKKIEWVKTLLKTKSRTALTSGGLEPVADSGAGGRNSIFANAFIKELQNNNDLLEGQELYRKISADIVVATQRNGNEQVQVPEYAPIDHAGHEGGEFFFRPE